MSATVRDQVAMVTDVFQVRAIDAAGAVAILRETCGLSSARCAWLLAREYKRRLDEIARRDREADRRADGSWSDDWGGWAS